MEGGSSLEAALEDVRRKHAVDPPPVKFTQNHREFLDRLRNRHWVSSSQLPDKPRTKITLLRNEWIERRNEASSVEYRITEAGLAALRGLR